VDGERQIACAVSFNGDQTVRALCYRCADEGDSTLATTRPSSSSRTRRTPSSASATCWAKSVYTDTLARNPTVSLCILRLMYMLTNDFLLQILRAAQDTTHYPFCSCHPAPLPRRIPPPTVSSLAQTPTLKRFFLCTRSPSSPSTRSSRPQRPSSAVSQQGWSSACRVHPTILTTTALPHSLHHHPYRPTPNTPPSSPPPMLYLSPYCYCSSPRMRPRSPSPPSLHMPISQPSSWISASPACR
jgi:hypothetical protein